MLDGRLVLFGSVWIGGCYQLRAPLQADVIMQEICDRRETQPLKRDDKNLAEEVMIPKWICGGILVSRNNKWRPTSVSIVVEEETSLHKQCTFSSAHS